MGWYRDYRKRLSFYSSGWDNSRSAIWGNPKRNGRCIGAEKNPANGDSGIYSLQELHDAAYSTSAAAFEFIGYHTGTTTNGGAHTFTYSNISAGTVQEGDLIVCVFGRGNTQGFYDDVIGYTPEEENGNYTFVTGAQDGGDDSYDHDHAIFQRTVGAGETSISFNPDNLGTPSYQACAFHYFVFRGATGVDSGAGSITSNYSRINTAGRNSTSLEADQFVVFSHAHAYYNTSYTISTASSNYEATPGRLSSLANDTDDINMQSWLYKATATETWTSPSFTGSATSSSDATLVSVRVY